MTIKLSVEYRDKKEKDLILADQVTSEGLSRIVREMFGLSHFKLERRSKKSKGFVPLETYADYKALKRSLQVNNNLVLRVTEDCGAHDHDHGDDIDDAETVAIDGASFKRLCQNMELISEKLNMLDGMTIGFDIPQDTAANSCSHGCSSSSSTGNRAGPAPAYTATVSTEDLGTKVKLGYHPRVWCDGCSAPGDNKEVNLVGNRYKCLLCNDFDLCESCYESGKPTRFHFPEHPMAKIPPLNFLYIDKSIAKGRVGVFPTVFCDSCCPTDAKSNTSMTGSRYKCQDCYNYDLCASCYSQGLTSENHSASHRMTRMEPEFFVDFGTGIVSKEEATAESSSIEPEETPEETPEAAPQPIDIIDTSNWEPEYKAKVEQLRNKFSTAAQLSCLEQSHDAYLSLIALSEGHDLKSLVEAGLKALSNSPKPETPTMKASITLTGSILCITITNLSLKTTFPRSTLEFTSLSDGKQFKAKIGITKPILYNGFMRLYVDVSRFHTDETFEACNDFAIRMTDPKGEEVLSGECRDGSGSIIMTAGEEPCEEETQAQTQSQEEAQEEAQEKAQEEAQQEDLSATLQTSTVFVDEKEEGLSSSTASVVDTTDATDATCDDDDGDLIVLKDNDTIHGDQDIFTSDEVEEDAAALEDYDVLSADDWAEFE